MKKILILYYSRTGNTEKMANAIEDGIRPVKGVEVELTYQAVPEELIKFDVIVIGTPTYHHTMTISIKNLLEEVVVRNIILKDKIGASFGSYGWSGEAPRLVLEIMKNKFEMHVIEPPLHIKYAPDRVGLEKCREFGKKIAEKLTRTFDWNI